MACNSKEKEYDPIWESELKDESSDELEQLIVYSEEMKQWLVDKGIHTSQEEIIVFRAGVPTVTNLDELEAREVYEADGNDVQLIESISIDAIKISKKVTKNNKTYSQPYTFKSRFTHTIYDKYFHDGVTNKTGMSYLDNVDINLSAQAPAPVEYNGESPIQLVPEPLPASVYNCLTYLSQNMRLYKVTVASPDDLKIVDYANSTEEEEVYIPKNGDVIYYTTGQFYNHLTDIIASANRTLGNMATPYEEDIMELLTDLGLDEAFKDLEYGGNLDELRLAIRIPASRSNQEALELMLGDDDIWDNIFAEDYVTMADNDVEASSKKDDLLDVYSSDKTSDYPRLNDMDYYGCYVDGSEGEEDSHTLLDSRLTADYRHWYVNQEWLMSLTPEQRSIIFWMGFDLVTDYSLPSCRADQVIMIVLVIVLTYYSLGALGPNASAIAEALLISSAIVSIAGIVGAIDSDKAAKASIILGLMSGGISLATMALNSTSTWAQIAIECMKLAGTMLSAYGVIEQEKFDREQEDIIEETEQLTEDAELFESNLRLSYGAVYDMPIRDGCESDPYEYIKDRYADYASFSTYENGFRNG